MDDGRTFLPPIKPGWRWFEGRLRYRLSWEKEDQELSDSEITRKALLGSLVGVEDYLHFTMETQEDFKDQWLPTLDTKLKVEKKTNQVLYAFFEKPTSSNVTVQRRTAMGEDAKIQIVSNDLVRRLQNNSEDLGAEAKRTVVDDYSQKLINSGYSKDQVRKIIVNGIKGYEGKRRRTLAAGKGLHRSSKDSLEQRTRKKLLGKTCWFKKKTQKPENDASQGKGLKQKVNQGSRDLETMTVLFIEQTPGGELASRLRGLFRRIGPMLGFKVKIVERTGQSLKSKFPLSSLWDGTMCARRTVEHAIRGLRSCCGALGPI